jgi:hypothetical protein
MAMCWRDYGAADLVTVYLLPSATRSSLPPEKQLKKGTRIVSHDFLQELAAGKD